MGGLCLDASLFYKIRLCLSPAWTGPWTPLVGWANFVIAYSLWDQVPQLGLEVQSFHARQATETLISVGYFLGKDHIESDNSINTFPCRVKSHGKLNNKFKINIPILVLIKKKDLNWLKDKSICVIFIISSIIYMWLDICNLPCYFASLNYLYV